MLKDKIEAIKGIGPTTAAKILELVEAEIDTVKTKMNINPPWCTDVKIDFYHDFGFDGLEDATKIGEIKTWFISDHEELKSMFKMINEYGEMERSRDTYAGAVVTLEFGALNG